MTRTTLLLLGVVGLAGCASTKPTKARTEVGDILADRAGLPDAIPPRQDAESRDQVRERVERLAADPLTVDRAVQIAVLNNRDLQAVFEELGIAQADLVQAGLLQNPVIAGDLVVSTRGNGLGGGLSLSQSLLSVFLIPAQRRLAKSRLRHAVVTVGHASLDLVRDVKVAFYTAQAAESAVELQRTLVQAAEVTDALARRQFEAGNITPLDRELFARALDEARIELADATVDAKIEREHLNRLLGFWGHSIEWRFAGPLDEILPSESSLASLEQVGVEQRLDLSAARYEVESVEYAVKLRRRGFIPQIDGDFVARNEVGNDEGHEWVLGPGLALELPIFDPGHADFARLRALLRQAQHRLQDQAITARSEIRVHREQLVAARRKVDYYRDTVLPRTASIAELTMEQYNAMLIGTYQLLETRSDQVEARLEYVEAVREYWVERSELEFAVGGSLPGLRRDERLRDADSE